MWVAIPCLLCFFSCPSHASFYAVCTLFQALTELATLQRRVAADSAERDRAVRMLDVAEAKATDAVSREREEREKRILAEEKIAILERKVEEMNLRLTGKREVRSRAVVWDEKDDDGDDDVNKAANGDDPYDDGDDDDSGSADEQRKKRLRKKDNDRIERVEKERDAANTRVNALTQRIQELEKQLSGKDELISQLESKAEGREAELAGVKKHLKTAMEEMKRVSHKLADAYYIDTLVKREKVRMTPTASFVHHSTHSYFYYIVLELIFSYLIYSIQRSQPHRHFEMLC